MHDFVSKALRGGVVSAVDRPDLERALNSSRFRGELEVVLPGVYCRVGASADLDVRMKAAALIGPDAVVTRRAAASLWWPEIDVDVVVVADKHKRVPADGFVFEQRLVQERHRSARAGVVTTAPALTVLDLIPELGSSVVDEALRRKVVTLTQLKDMLRQTPKRRDNALRADVLADSRDSPWSPLERRAHRLLRDAGIGGWVANHRVQAGARVFYIDIAFPRLKVGVEIDGREFHGDNDAFHADRARDAALAAQGWLIVRFTVRTLETLPIVLRDIVRSRRRA